MAGEAIKVASAYATAQASSAPANGAFASGGLTDVVTAFGVTVEDYLLLDFRLNVTAGVPTENAIVTIYRIPGDGTNNAPLPAGAYAPHRVGEMVLDNATGYYHLRGVENQDGGDRFVWYNSSGVALTATLEFRARTAKAAP